MSLIFQGSVATCLVGIFVWVVQQISQAFQQCKNFENRLGFDKITESLKMGTFFETQCRNTESG